MHSIVWGLLCAALPLLANGQGPAFHRYKVVIHEIFADPSPAIGLPEWEFVELRNIGATPVNLEGWQLRDSTQAMKLPAYWLQPDSLVVLSARPLFSPGIAGTGFPSLSNEGETLALYNREGALIHAVAYHKSWYEGSIKAGGGWSLEMKDPEWPCAGAANWKAAVAAEGGTPGKANSVAGTVAPPPLPGIVRISVTDSMSITLHLSESVDSAQAALPENYQVEHIAAVTVVPPLFNRVVIGLGKPLEAGRTYSLQAGGLRDCAGRDAGPLPPVAFALPVRPGRGELVINELLFDPPPGAPDFVEVHNAGSNALELHPLHIASFGADGVLKDTRPLTDGPRLLMPGDYLAFTEDAAALCRAYTCKGALLQVPALPTMPMDEGRIALLFPDGAVVDSLYYHRSFHLATLPSPRGVSLERLDPAQPALQTDNWHSAAATAGYATPGYANSQRAGSMAVETGKFTVQPAKFTPDNNGMDDVAAISWQLLEPGYTGTILVMDALGREVRLLAGNLLLGNSGKVYWDGLTAQKMPASPGIYIIFIRIFNPAGRVKTWKLPLVLDAG